MGIPLQVLAAVNCYGGAAVEKEMDAEIGPLLPKGTSVQAWAAKLGSADREHKEKVNAKPGRRKGSRSKRAS